MKRIILLVIATLSVLVTDAQCLKIEYAGDVLSEKEQQLVERMMVYHRKSFFAVLVHLHDNGLFSF